MEPTEVQIHNRFYEDYEVDPGETPLSSAAAIIEDVHVLRTGDRIAGFEKRTNPAEITRWHRDHVIGYDPDQQRGWRVRYRDGEFQDRVYRIKKEKVKAIARGIAENRGYNRFRTVNARLGHVRLYFQPYEPDGLSGRLHLFQVDSGSEFTELLSTPDSAHRQEGDKYFTEELVGKGKFSVEHAGFDPETYDLILHITLTDTPGEGEAHYEHNELITKSTATRRSWLEGGQTQAENWVVHELVRRDPVFGELVEIYEKSISSNSPKTVTFNTLAKGVAESWSEEIKTSKQEVANQLSVALQMAREAVPEWGPLPFRLRREEREKRLYSQAITQRALLRVLSDLHEINQSEGKAGDWANWAPTLKKLKEQPDSFEDGEYQFTGEFLSRDNPRFFRSDGQTIYAMNKTAREEKESLGAEFKLDPKKHLTVQNTRLSLDAMYGFLSTFLGYRERLERARQGS